MLKRLREAREFLGLSQPAFAAQIDISRERLANYETSRTPLPCDLALRICSQFIIGERWLATGEGPMRQYLAMNGAPRVFRLPFGEAYDTALVKEAMKLASEMDKDGTFFAMSKISYWNPKNRQFYKNFFDAILGNWMDKLKAAGKEDEAGDLVGNLVDHGQDYFEELLDRELRRDPKTDEFYWFMKSTGQRKEMDPPETEERKAERRQQRATSKKIWDQAREVAHTLSKQAASSKKAPRKKKPLFRTGPAPRGAATATVYQTQKDGKPVLKFVLDDEKKPDNALK